MAHINNVGELTPIYFVQYRAAGAPCANDCYFCLMKLWTCQDLGFYDNLKRDGMIWCNAPGFIHDSCSHAYPWMVQQMNLRMGRAPYDSIKFPIWAWYQYTSRKSAKPPLSPSLLSSDCDKALLIEVEKNDDEVLLSDFMLWHGVLNGWNIKRDKALDREIDKFVKEAGCGYDFQYYPDELKERIIATWGRIFEFTRDRYYSPRHKRNLSIQATFWTLNIDEVRNVWTIKK